MGFALTILQRRLASSPEAIYQSLRRRRERLENRLQEVETQQREDTIRGFLGLDELDDEMVADLEEAPENEIAASEEQILDQATAARTAVELQAEFETLERLEALAQVTRRSGEDAIWLQLASLLSEIFTRLATQDAEDDQGFSADASASQKLVIFTEHRDTLSYLERRVVTLLGRPLAVVTSHGSMRREVRLKTQESFRHDSTVQILIATDAAGEGINLQQAHQMVNYDLPWNPNRLEQRFGRIHRIGQTEVCRLWNLLPDSPKQRLPLRKGIADTTLRARLCQEINDRAGEHLSTLRASNSFGAVVLSFTHRKRRRRRSVRALDPTGKDRSLLPAIADPRFTVIGFNNKDLRTQLAGDTRYSGKTEQQRSRMMTRSLRLLREHGVIRRLPKSRRYQLTSKGREFVTSLQAVLAASTEELTRMAA